MAGERIFTGAPSNMTTTSILLQNPRPNSQSLFLPISPSIFGSRSMVSFEDVKGTKRSFFSAYDENGEDDYFYQAEKKRRLSADQVEFLEKSFEVENKLEPERKTKIAKDLGLQPRQVAIWFQNRRARWKSKQLEKDYESLNDSYESLKTAYDNILKEKERLQAQVVSLTEKVVAREKLQEVKGLLEEPQKKPLLDSISEGEEYKHKVSVGGCISNNKQEDVTISSSTKSDILDSESPRYTDATLVETGDSISSYAFEPEQSDLSSQDEEDSLLHDPYMFTKLEDHHHHHHHVNYSDPPQSSCNFGFLEEEDHHTFWPWSY